MTAPIPPAGIAGAGRKGGLDAGVVGVPWSQTEKEESSPARTQTFFDSCRLRLYKMRFTIVLVTLCLVAGSMGSLLLDRRSTSGIAQSTYDDLVRYTKYSSGAYQLLCIKPLGNKLVESVR